MSKKIPVIEIFGPTIQGEGNVIGQQTFFIRLGLCDYKCTMCDSMHAVDPANVKRLAKYLDSDELFSQLIAFREASSGKHINNVSLSGGNPAIHADLHSFFEKCDAAGIDVALETQGTIWQDWIPACNTVTVSPKTPGMGASFEESKFIAFMQKLVANNIDWSVKIVVFNAMDIEFAASIFAILREALKLATKDRLFLSLGNSSPPAYIINADTDQIQEQSVKQGILERVLLRKYRQLGDDIMKHPRLGDVRFLPQLHVLTYGNTQGY